MKTVRQKIHNFIHESAYSSMSAELPVTVADFNALDYFQRLELFRKRPELYRRLAEEAKEINLEQ